MRIIITSQAERDLLEIRDHILNSYSAPLTAFRLMKKIDKKIAMIADMPYSCAVFQSEPWKSKGLRRFTVDRYCGFYFVDEEAQTVRIYRIVYGRRNIDELL